MVKFVAIIVLLTGVLNTGMSKECNEQDLLECLADSKKAVTTELRDIKATEKSSYCQAMDNKGKCLTEASEACREKKPKISNLISSLYTYLNHMCTDNGKVYMEIAPCLAEHREEFEKCKRQEINNPDKPLEEICGSVNGMQCMAKLSKKLCKNGESFGQALEAQVETLKSVICSGARRSLFCGHFYLTLVLMLLILFSNRNKF